MQGPVSSEQRATVVVGQGAMGTYFATLLAQAGERVHVVSSRAEQADTTELRVTGGHELSAEVTLAPDFPAHPASRVLLAGRAERAVEQAPEASKHLAEEGVVVPLQNGLASLEVAARVGEDRTVPITVGFNACMRDERTVEKTSRGGVTVGHFSRTTRPQAERLVRELVGSMPAKPTTNPAGAIWSKWCISCAINGLAVITGQGVGPLTRKRAGRDALIGIVTECVELAELEGVKLERVAGPLTPSTLAGSPTGLGGALRHGVVRLIGRGYGSVVPSSLDALQGGRDPELDALNGEAVHRGHQHGVATPWNRAVHEAGNTILAGDLEPGQGALERVVENARGA